MIFVSGRSHNLPGNMASSQLFVDPEGLSEPPEHYAWIAGAGIKYGDLDSSQSADAFKIFTGEKYYKYEMKICKMDRVGIFFSLFVNF